MSSRITRRGVLQSAASCAALAHVAPIWAGARRRTSRPHIARDLPRTSPAQVGVSSAGVLAFLDAAEKEGHELHSFMLLRRGRIAAEGWWAPYRPHAIHMLFSLSKSFTSTAVGLAVAEGLLRLEDRVIEFFPERLPSGVSDNLAALNVEHLLTMSVGHAQHSTGSITQEDDWVRAFLALPIEHRPGSTFLYDSGVTYMLSAIVQKVSGQKLVDYLKPRLFTPLGIRNVAWESCPRGINTGGFGMSATTDALAKLGQLYLQKGRWNGKQILLAAWAEAATSARIQQPETFLGKPGATLESLRQTSDWHQGYGYQFWRCRHGAVRGDGAFGQFCIVMPDQQAVLAITSRAAHMQGLLDLVWANMLPAVSDRPFIEDAATRDKLQERLAALTLSTPSGISIPDTARAIAGRSFELEPNAWGAQQVSFDFARDSCLFQLQQGGISHNVRCGYRRWIDGVIQIPDAPRSLRITARSVPASLRSQVAAAARWKDAKTLEMQWRYFETPHLDEVTCTFDGSRVAIEFLSSIERQTLEAYPALRRAEVLRRPVLHGQMSL